MVNLWDLIELSNRERILFSRSLLFIGWEKKEQYCCFYKNPEMGFLFGGSRYLRIYDTSQVADLTTIKGNKDEEIHNRKTGKSLRAKVLHRVFSEDFERAKKRILDPGGKIIRKWSSIFFAACLVSLFVDPLFFFLPIARGDVCIDITTPLKVILTIIRSVVDIFYWIHIFVKFHTAYVAPSSRVFGRGELVIEPSKIAERYLHKGFWLDLVAALPLPQMLIWVIDPHLEGWAVIHSKNILWFSILFQYLPRVYLIFPLSSQIEATGIVMQTSWAGAAYNLLLFMLAGHVSGACWYLLSIQRQEDCWHRACNLEKPYCPNKYFDCRNVKDPTRVDWFKSSNVTNQCQPNSELNYQFGIYGDAVSLSVAGSAFMNKYFYCLWWGLKNLSTLGQNLVTTIHVGENIFVTIVAILGLVLFALLIGNMQRFLQSMTKRLEEWRIKRTDTEKWMHYRQLSPQLRQSIRKYDQYKWLATKGVDEQSLIKSLPIDLQRKVKRHLCIDLVRRVPLFDQMDETTLDAICERLKLELCAKGMFLLHEGDPVNQMLFIIRGDLESYTTNGGRTGFFNSSRIGPGDFCCEELLTWALDPHTTIILPSSTRTVKAISEVEAFALTAEDLKFVAAQFRRLHSEQVKHKLRFYSHQWRTWAACFIQAAWHRHKKLKEMAELMAEDPREAQSESFQALCADNQAAGGKRSFKYKQSGSHTFILSSVQKPTDPDFSVDPK